MKKRSIALLMTLLILAQTFLPSMTWASNETPPLTQSEKLVKVGSLDLKRDVRRDQGEIFKIQARANKNARRRRSVQGTTFMSADSPYLPGQSPTDEEKASAYGNVTAKFSAVGLKDGSTTLPFQWKEIFGQDSNGNPSNAKIYFLQKSAEDGSEINRFTLLINEAGDYKWTDQYGKEAKLPLYSKDLKPYKYEVALDYDVSDKVKLLTMEVGVTNDEHESNSKFEKDSDGNVCAKISLEIGIAQVASTKFVAKWNTDLAEADRPKVEALYNTKNKDTEGVDIENSVFFPTSDGEIKLRNDENAQEPDQFNSQFLRNVPEVKVVEGIKFKDEEDLTGTPTYKFDETNKTITTNDGNHKFKYDFSYDVINGGKLTMTEVLKVTFNANGGKFEASQDPIIKEVDYDKAVELPSDPTNATNTFLGWGNAAADKTSVAETELKNIRQDKTLYAIWSNDVIEEIEGQELKKPQNYVKVTVDKTDKAKLKENEKQTRIFWVNPDKQVTLPVFKPEGIKYKVSPDTSFRDEKQYVFKEWTSIETPKRTWSSENITGKFSQETTIEASWTRTSDGGVRQKGNTKPDVPDNYIQVVFDPTYKGKFSGEEDLTDGRIIYWVNPKLSEYVLGIKNPYGKEYIPGFSENWEYSNWGKQNGVEPKDPNKPKKGYTDVKLIPNQLGSLTIIKAEYDLDNIMAFDQKTPMARPEYTKSGKKVQYWKVEFDSDDGLTLKNQKSYYVKVGSDSKFSYPSITFTKPVEKTGYKFDGWYKGNQKLNEYDIINSDVVLTARSINLSNVIPEKDSTGNKNEKPEGYITVTFKSEDESKGKVTSNNVFYVNPKEYVTLNAPATKAEHGYEFAAWDKNISTPTLYEKDIEIKASFNQLGVLVPKIGNQSKPTNYVEITFVTSGDGGKIADGETTTYYADPTKDVKIPAPTIKTEIGYVFKGWNQDTTKAQKYPSDTTIKGEFEKKQDIIPSKDPVTKKANPKPEGYVRVKFVAGNDGSIANESLEKGQDLYYVNPKANKKLKDLTAPIINAKVGYELDKTNQWKILNLINEKPEYILEDLIVEAQYKSLPDQMPKKNSAGGDNEQPNGYVKVTFKAGDNGKVTETSYYVNPKKLVSLNPPTDAKGNVGYKFAGWSENISNYRLYDKDTDITASFNPIDACLPNTSGQAKPDGYVEVKFEIEGSGGNIESGQTTTYYADPNKDVTIPSPKIKAEIGYEFGGWNLDTTEAQKYPGNTTIKGAFTPLSDVVPGDKAKPEGYKTVTFKADANGSLSGTTIYYVNPNKSVDLTTQAEGIAKNPKVGFAEGTWSEAISTKEYKNDVTYTFKFTSLPDVDTTSHLGYVRVEFQTDGNGSLEGNTIYYVNPTKDVKIGSANLQIPNRKPNTGYEFDKWNETIDPQEPVKSDKTYVAYFKKIQVTMTYKADDADSASKNRVISYDKGKTITIAGANGLTKANHKFKGWKIGETTYQPGQSFIINEDTIATADWDKSLHDVAFDTDGGSFISPQKVEHDSKLASFTNPNKQDYTFVGWVYKENNNEVKFDPNTDTIKKDLTLIAKYEPNVIQQMGQDKPQNVPASFVQVVIESTDKATVAETKTFWVAKDTEVNLPVSKPVGKTVPKAESKPEFSYLFSKWESDEDTPREWTDLIKGAFSKDKTTISAQYTEKASVAGDVKINPIYVSESIKDARGAWINKYIPTEADLKKAVVLGAGDKIEILPENNDLQTELYEKLKENGKTDREELSRVANIKAKVTFNNGTTKEIEIPIVVYKNIYQALTFYSKPDYVKSIERSLGDEYIRVLLIPTEKAVNQQRAAFYVRKNAAVIIPGQDPTGRDNYTFIEWKANNQNPLAAPQFRMFRSAGLDPKVVENDEKVELGSRHRFDKDTDIVAQYSERPVQPQNPGVNPGPGAPGRIIVVERNKNTSKNDLQKVETIRKEISYMQGYENEFRPYDGLTRAEAAQILANALKEDGFRYDPNYKISYPDVGDYWYTQAVKIVTQAGVFEGHLDGYFKPQEKITRAQWIATIKRFQGLADKNGNHMMLKEGHWATAEVEAAYNEGWLEIYDRKLVDFKSDEPISRQEVAAVTNRAFKRLVDKTYLRRNDRSLINYSDINPEMWSYEDILCASNTLLCKGAFYTAHWINKEKNVFNINTEGWNIIQEKFQRNPR